MATESLQARLTEFERQARGVCIGVNHLALDSERVRQAELLQKIIQLEKDIQQSSTQKSHLPDAAAEIRDDVKNNTSALRYLETISQLENSFTVKNVTETSVQLSAPKELKDEVHVKKELTSNVKSCWTYVSQLARLSQVHIRNAAEYHQVSKHKIVRRMFTFVKKIIKRRILSYIMLISNFDRRFFYPLSLRYLLHIQ
ncbi:unnamed protein product [Schistosoma margrebowiei]|uniref:Uncharacterized protein n=1 Tax=Schistosoma margrebowiei TaxID=48269 RepID=A0A183LVV9_9TREM|nr:unnamed protein product [Schistosoma margrebowiei]